MAPVTLRGAASYVHPLPPLNSVTAVKTTEVSGCSNLQLLTDIASLQSAGMSSTADDCSLRVGLSRIDSSCNIIRPHHKRASPESNREAVCKTARHQYRAVCSGARPADENCTPICREPRAGTATGFGDSGGVCAVIGGNAPRNVLCDISNTESHRSNQSTGNGQPANNRQSFSCVQLSSPGDRPVSTVSAVESILQLPSPLSSKYPAVPRKDKSLSILCNRFLEMFPLDVKEEGGKLLLLDATAACLGTERRRIYDIVNILESLEFSFKVEKNRYMWRGRRCLQATLYKLRARGYQLRVAQQLHDAVRLLGEESSGAEKSRITEDPPASPVVYHAAPVASGKRSLGDLAQRFLMLFLVSDQLCISQRAVVLTLFGSRDGVTSTVKEEVAAAGGGGDVTPLRTRVRRLYDVANILHSVGLVERVFMVPGRRPVYRYCGPRLWSNTSPSPPFHRPETPQPPGRVRCARGLISQDRGAVGVHVQSRLELSGPGPALTRAGIQSRHPLLTPPVPTAGEHQMQKYGSVGAIRGALTLITADTQSQRRSLLKIRRFPEVASPSSSANTAAAAGTTPPAITHQRPAVVTPTTLPGGTPESGAGFAPDSHPADFQDVRRVVGDEIRAGVTDEPCGSPPLVRPPSLADICHVTAGERYRLFEAPQQRGIGSTTARPGGAVLPRCPREKRTQAESEWVHRDSDVKLTVNGGGDGGSGILSETTNKR